MSVELKKVEKLITGCMKNTSLGSFAAEIESVAGGGKMLRARLMFAVGRAAGTSEDVLIKSAAAVELIHAASLLHDDVVDGGQLRRGMPTFWKRKGVSGAVLLGDLLVCKAIEVLCGVDNGRLVEVMIRCAGEMCDAEVEQELVLRGNPLNWTQCVDIARRKTGALFAFAGYAGAYGNSGLRELTMEAGYKAGTAYQLADDILDAYGDVEMSGKTLGRDAERGKITAVTAWQDAGVSPVEYINGLCDESCSMLTGNPAVLAAWEKYLEDYMMPSINSHIEKFAVEAAC